VPFPAGEAAAMVAASRAAGAVSDDERTLSGVVDLLERVACLAAGHDELETLVINPALASPEGAWVVDSMIRVRPAPARTDPVRSMA
jgi:ATP-grasp domain